MAASKPSEIAKSLLLCHIWEEVVIQGRSFLKEFIYLIVKEGNILLA